MGIEAKYSRTMRRLRGIATEADYIEPELAAAIAEYDELKRKSEGEKKPQDFLKKGSRLLHCGKREKEGWTQDKTASDLNISQQAVSRAICWDGNSLGFQAVY